MVLIGIIALVVANVFSTGVTGFFTTDYRKESLDQARLALDRMAKEIRNIKSRADISTTTSMQLCFKASNILSDDTSTTDDIIISYRYNGSAIIREELASLGNCPGSSGNTLATNITAFTFSYLKGDDTADSSQPDDTRKIRITLTSSSSGEDVQLQTEVWLRNPVTVSATIPPDAPTNVSGSPSGTCTLILSWTNSVSTDTVSHKIYKCITAIGSPSTSSCFSLLAQVSVPTSFYSDTLSISGRDYHYKLTAVDADANESTFSSEYIYTFNSSLAAPTGMAFTGLTCTSTIDTANLLMQWNAYAGATSYKIYRNMYAEGGSVGTYTTYDPNVPTNNYTDLSLSSRMNHSYKASAVTGGCETQQSTTAITADVDPVWFAGNAGGSPDICDGTNNKDECKFYIQQDSGQTLSLTGITVDWTGGVWQGGAGSGTIDRIQIGGVTKTAACTCGTNCWANGASIPLTATNLNTATSTTINIRWCTKASTVPNPITTKWQYNVTLPDSITGAQGCQITVYP